MGGASNEEQTETRYRMARFEALSQAVRDCDSLEHRLRSVAVARALVERARRESGAVADRLFAEACGYCTALVETWPHDPLGHSTWGAALFFQARERNGEEALRLCQAAADKLAVALGFGGDHAPTLRLLGLVHQRWAELAPADQSEHLYAKAFESFEGSLRVEPKDSLALAGSALALERMAQTAPSGAAELLDAACDRYSAALRLRPMDAALIERWARLFYNKAKRRHGEQADLQLERERQRCLASEAKAPRSRAYRLACLCALRGEMEECRRWLANSDAPHPDEI